MAVYREAHRRLVLLPERRASFDIREEEGDGAGGKIGHGASQDARPGVNPADCRMGVPGSRQTGTDLSFRPRSASGARGGTTIACPAAAMFRRSAVGAPLHKRDTYTPLIHFGADDGGREDVA